MASMKWNILKLLSIAGLFLWFSMVLVHAIDVKEFCDENSIDISDLNEEAGKMGVTAEKLVSIMKKDLKSRSNPNQKSLSAGEDVVVDLSKQHLSQSSTSSSSFSDNSGKKTKGKQRSKAGQKQLKELQGNNMPMLYIPKGSDPTSALRAIRNQRAMEDLYADHFKKALNSRDSGDTSPVQLRQEHVPKPPSKVSKSGVPKKRRRPRKTKRARHGKKRSRRYRRRKAPRKTGMPIAPMMPAPSQFRPAFGPPPIPYPPQEQFPAQEFDQNTVANKINNELSWTPLIICSVVGIFVIFCIVAGLCFCTLKSKQPMNRKQPHPPQAPNSQAGGRDQGSFPPNQNIGVIGYAAIPSRGAPHL